MSNQNLENKLQHPIPPPTYDQQYRAIGLVFGIYEPHDRLTRGEMILSNNIRLETVLLGRVINVVKKHINLAEPQLWVVYPRTRKKNDYLHLQIVGVWAPDTLTESLQRSQQLAEEAISEVNIEPGYFSVRGEVVFYSQTEQKIIVKIKRSAESKPNFFKLRLNGVLGEEKDNIGWFWDFHVQLKGDELVVMDGEKIALINSSKKQELSKKNHLSSDRPSKKIISKSPAKPSPTQKKPKPIPRRRKQRSSRDQDSELN